MDSKKEQHIAEPFNDRVYEWCNSPNSVSSALAADPSIAPGDAWLKLYGHNVKKPESSKAVDHAGEGTLSQDALERAERCGKWGPTKPSELFLRVSGPGFYSMSETNRADSKPRYITTL